MNTKPRRPNVSIATCAGLISTRPVRLPRKPWPLARQQLLRPFPQFGAVGTFRQDGTNDYKVGRLRIEKRFKRGYSFLAAYTCAENISRDNLLNDTDAEIEWRIDPDDVPHRFVVIC